MYTQIIAHRGASKYAPENTMPAFELAYDMGADGIETDVQLTKDGIPVLIHDVDVKRTTNGKGLVKDATFEELKTLDAGNYFSHTFAGTAIPSLEEFLIWATDKKLHLHLELKANPLINQAFERIVLDMVKKHRLEMRTTFSSFHKRSLQRLREMDATADIAWLTAKKTEQLFQIARELKVNALHLKYNLLHDKLVKQLQAENITYRVYTVNRPISIKRSIRYLCDGIISDVPDTAIKIRNKWQQKNETE